MSKLSSLMKKLQNYTKIINRSEIDTFSLKDTADRINRKTSNKKKSHPRDKHNAQWSINRLCTVIFGAQFCSAMERNDKHLHRVIIRTNHRR